MARDKDSDALIAFTSAFKIVPRKKQEKEKVRIGKAVIALEGVDKALAWAEQAGVDPDDLQGYRTRALSLMHLAKDESEKQKSDMKDLEAIKVQCRELQDRIYRLRAKKKITDIPDNAGIFVNDIPGLDELSERDREGKIAEVRQQVCRGSTLMESLQNGDLDGRTLSTDNVIDICWYLKGMAQEKLEEPYTQGALTLEDPDGKLAKLFDSCEDVYPRGSSHLRPEQQQEGSQGRGIDAGGRYPAGMNTLLYHPFTTKNGEKRLYLKFETAGAYGHVGDKREVFRRPKNEEDDKQSEAHAKAFVSGTKDEGLAETREGTVDLAVQAAYNEVYEEAPDFRQILGRGKQKSKQNKQGKITGFSRALSFTPLAPNYWDVQSQQQNIDDLVTALAGQRGRLQELRGGIQAWVAAMANAGYNSDADRRLGDEVVLQQADLKAVKSPIQGEGDVDQDSLTSFHDLFKKRRGLQAGLLEGNRKNVSYVYYKKLRFDEQDGPHEYDNVLNLDMAAEQFADYEVGGKVAVGKITKGTNLLKKKWFQFTGNVSRQEMFAALASTGWKMANLTNPDHLEKQ